MKWICAFCGSSDRAESMYDEAVSQFATELCHRGIGLVYGGGSGGPMGALADAVLGGGGEVVGVHPKSIREREAPHDGLTELVVTETKDERKEHMFDRADGFVAFPGGIGTHEELFDALGRAKHGFHDNPCGVLNVGGYYDHLVAHLDRAEAEGFLSGPQRDLVLVESTPSDLLDRFEGYRSPITD
ncbi:MAG: TIGR00730 family Rossman fold protein [Halobacteriota archaeon]